MKLTHKQVLEICKLYGIKRCSAEMISKELRIPLDLVKEVIEKNHPNG